MKTETLNIFIHRRDLRVIDNSALIKLHNVDPNVKVLHIFIFNPQQIDPKNNLYFSKNSVEYLVQCLHDLNIQLNDGLHCFHGKDIDILTKLIKTNRFNNIAFNLDYTPFARKRDGELKEWCQTKGIGCVTEEDYTLFPIDKIRNDKGSPYEVFTPFYRKCLSEHKYIRTSTKDFDTTLVFRNKKLNGLIKNINKYYFNSPNYKLAVHGGRNNALDIIKNKVNKGAFTNYDDDRNIPSIDKTTKLSAYIKYGCVSIREVYESLKSRYGISHGLVRELFWREFYALTAYHFPRVLQGQTRGENHAFRIKYDTVKWKYNEGYWNALVQGKTGYPMVDAGVRQLLTTGWCHNRSRMVIAMFAAKDLHLPPNDVERWFATQFVDYDPASNSGGVQWSYGIGCDSEFYRIFNPFLQSERFDNDTTYIKKWVHELLKVPSSDIHKWHTAYKKYIDVTIYPQPIVDHALQSQKVKQLFRDTD